MAKKSMKEAAAAGTSVFDTIAQGAQRGENVQTVQNAKAVQYAKNVLPAKNGRPAKYAQPMERLNLKIPADVKEYLYAAAYRESGPKKTVSVTEYLCELVRADMEKHKDD